MLFPTKPNVLLVDDLKSNLDLLQDMLSGFDVNFELANNGQEAIECIQRDVYALIILDVNMPKLDGFAVVEKMKTFNLAYPTPVLFITGVEKSMKKMMRGYELGAVDYLLKPFDVCLLTSKTKVFLDLYKQRIDLQNEVANRSEVENKLRMSTQNLQSIIDGIPECICVVDARCQIKKANPAGVWLFGQESAISMLEKRFVQYIHRDDRASFEECLTNSFKAARSYCEVRFFKNESEERKLAVNLIPIIFGNNQVDQVLLFATDVTDKQLVESKLRESETQLFKDKIMLEKNYLELRRFNKNVEEKCRNLEEKVRTSVDRLLLPLISRLRQLVKNEDDSFIQLIERVLLDLNVEGKFQLSEAYSSLSDKEIEICNLIKCGYSTKGMSEALELSEKTIQTHRSKIRRKLGISNKDVNLTTHLQSI